ncbi:MAG: hypothetical protein IRY92_14115, partial [Dactylosporangium sp.]|nr:hypothetical protein [Dactylosporangium sp.]
MNDPQRMAERTDTTLRDDPVFVRHEGGKLAVAATVPLASREDLSIAYTPGVAR